MPNRIEDLKMTELSFFGPDYVQENERVRDNKDSFMFERTKLQLEQDKRLFDLIWPNISRKPVKVIIKNDDENKEENNLKLKVDQYVRSWKRRRISKLIRKAFDPAYKEPDTSCKKTPGDKNPSKKALITVTKWDDTGKDLTILRDFSLCWKLKRIKNEKIAVRPVSVHTVQLITKKSCKYSDKRPRVVLEISAKSRGKLGRLIISLYSDYVPKTCKKFLSLCQEKKTIFSYKGCPFTMILSGFFCKTGDVSGMLEDSQGSVGKILKDEDFVLKHGEPGVLTIHPNTNKYQFYITFRKMKSFDGNHVAFGKVIKGMDTLKEMEKFGSDNGKPKDFVYISNCYEI